MEESMRMDRTFFRVIYIAPLIRTFRYFSSKTWASWGAEGLHSRIFSLSGLFGFVKTAECPIRKSRASPRESNASSSLTKVRGILRYLSKASKIKLTRKNVEGMILRFSNDNERLDSLSIYEVIHNVSSHVRSLIVQFEERMIVPHWHCTLNTQSVPNCTIRFLSRG